MKTQTQTQINWYATEQNDWTGIELIDTETGKTHATIDGCTPEALALIAAAPELLEALKGARGALRMAMPFIVDPDDTTHGGAQYNCGEWLDEINEAIAKAEGGAA